MYFQKIDRKNIEEKIGNKLFGLERSLLLILNETIPQSYSPSDKILAISIGCGDYSSEANIIKEFHRMRFNQDYGNIKVVGCDIKERTNYPYSTEHEYDFRFHGEIKGDALSDYPYEEGIKRLGDQKKDHYDFMLMCFPDLFRTDCWFRIAMKAYSYLSKGGILSIISEGKEDIENLEILRDKLSHSLESKLLIKYFNYSDLFEYGSLYIQK